MCAICIYIYIYIGEVVKQIEEDIENIFPFTYPTEFENEHGIYLLLYFII